MANAYQVQVLCKPHNFLPNHHKIHPIARPLGRSKVMYFVGSNCDLYSVSVTAVMYVISCYIEPHYNGSRLLFCPQIGSFFCQGKRDVHVTWSLVPLAACYRMCWHSLMTSSAYMDSPLAPLDITWQSWHIEDVPRYQTSNCDTMLVAFSPQLPSASIKNREFTLNIA